MWVLWTWVFLFVVSMMFQDVFHEWEAEGGIILRCRDPIYLCSELQTRQRLAEVCLQRADHDEHECF